MIYKYHVYSTSVQGHATAPTSVNGTVQTEIVDRSLCSLKLSTYIILNRDHPLKNTTHASLISRQKHGRQISAAPLDWLLYVIFLFHEEIVFFLFT